MPGGDALEWLRIPSPGLRDLLRGQLSSLAGGGLSMQRKAVYWLTRLAVRLYCSLFTKREVHGMENIPSHAGALLAANHRSMLDGFLLYSLAPRMASSLPSFSSPGL